MEFKFWKYNIQDALKVRLLFIAFGFQAIIAGSISKSGRSNKSIDIYLPQTENTHLNIEDIMDKLKVSRCIVRDGSLLLPNTLFGTLHIFFKRRENGNHNVQ